jgi:hypothetical protein
VLVLKTTRLKEKLDKLKEEMGKLAAYEKQMLASPDGQISLTDPDSRSMATSGRGSGVVGYNVQVAVDTVNHLIVTHEVTNTGSDRSQLANVAREAKAVLQVDKLEAVADRGYFNGEEILACEQAGICVTLPKPMTSGAKSEGRFGKQDFVYLPEEDVYRCPAGEKLINQARATGISVRIDKTDPFRRICREARAIIFIDTVGCGPQCLVPWTMVCRVDERPDARRGRRHGWQLEPIG